MYAIAGLGILNQMPHVLFLGAPRGVRSIPHTKLTALDRNPRIRDRIWIGFIELDHGESRTTREWRPLILGDRESQRVLPGHRNREAPAHVIKISLLTDRHNATD